MSKLFPWPMRIRAGIGSRPGPGKGGQLNTRFGLAPADLSGWIQTYWPSGVWVSAAEVAYHESGWNPSATLDTRYLANGECNQPVLLRGGTLPALSEWSIGYFQLNLCAHTAWTLAEVLDPETNVKYGAALYAASGWSPWYNTAQLLGLL